MFPYRRQQGASPLQTQNVQSDYGSQVRATWDSAWLEAPVMLHARDSIDRELLAQDTSPRLSADDAVQAIQSSGLSASAWELGRIEDGQYTQNQLDRYIRDRRERQAMYGIIGDNNGIVRGGSLFAVGMLSSMRDPVEFGMSLIPIAPGIKYARRVQEATRGASALSRALARSATGQKVASYIPRAGERLYYGAIDGAIGNALIEPYIYAQNQKSPFDNYTLMDSATNIGLGAVMGAGLSTTIGAVGDGIRAWRNRVGAPEVKPNAPLLLDYDRNTVRDPVEIKRGELQSMQEHAPDMLFPHQPEMRSVEGVANFVRSFRNVDPVQTVNLLRSLKESGIADRLNDVANLIENRGGASKVIEAITQLEGVKEIAGLRQQINDLYQQSGQKVDAPALREILNTQMSNELLGRNAAMIDFAMKSSGIKDAADLVSQARGDENVTRLLSPLEPASMKLKRALPDTRRDLLNTSVLQYALDKRLNLDAVLGNDPAIGTHSLNDIAKAVKEYTADVTNNLGYEKELAERIKPVDMVEPAISEQLSREREALNNAVTRYQEALKSYEEGILYSRGEPSDTPATVQHLEVAARESFGASTEKLMDAGKLRIVESVEDLPYGPHPLDTKAMTLPDGGVYVVARNTAPAEMRGILLHEVGVHANLKESIGDRVYTDLLNNVDESLARGEAWAQEARRNIPSDTPAAAMKEELLAYAVEYHPELPFSQKFISAIKTWFYKHFGIARNFMNLSAGDLAYLATSALRKAASEKAAGTSSSLLLYSRAADEKPFSEKVREGEADILNAQRLGQSIIDSVRAGDSPETIFAKLKDRLSDLDHETLRAASEEISNRVNEANTSNAARESADDIARQLAQEYASDMERAALHRQRVNYLNESKRLDLQNFVKNFVKTQFDSKTAKAQSKKLSTRDVEAFRAILEGSTHIGEGALNSVDAKTKALQQEFQGMLYSGLLERDAFHVFSEKANHKDIFIAAVELGRGGDLSRFSKEVVSVAEVITSVNEYMRARMNEQGANIGKLDSYVIPQSHDQIKIRRSGFETWRDFVMPLLDIKRTFTDRGVLDVQKSLRAIYDNLSDGVHEKGGADRVGATAFGAGRSIARKASESRLIHFMDGEAQYRYNMEFGSGDLAYSVTTAIQRTAMNIALMERLGTNPENMLSNLMDWHRDEIRGDVERSRKFYHNQNTILNSLKHVDGSANQVVNETLAVAGSASRSLQTLSKLGLVVLSSVADVSIQANNIRSWGGGNLFTSTLKTIKDMASQATPAERHILLDGLGYVNESVFGTFTSRFTAENMPMGKLGSAMHLFMKLNGMTGWIENMRRAHHLRLSAELGTMSAYEFGALPDRARENLSQYGINARKWDLLRQSVLPSEDGRKFLTPKAVNSIADSAFSAYLESTGRKATPEAIARERQRLADDVRTLLVNEKNIATTEPNAKTRRTMFGGSERGTFVGELIRSVMQFKSFSVTIWQQSLSREFHRGGVDSLGDFIFHGRSSMLNIASFLAMNTLFGYVAMTAKDLIKGKTPRDTTMGQTWVEAFTQGGGLGIYGDLILGDYNRFGGGLVETLAGPTLGSLGDFARVYSRAVRGDDAANAAVNAVISNTPFVNMHFVKPVLDYLILNRVREAMNPGAMRRARRRALRNGQEIQNWAMRYLGE